MTTDSVGGDDTNDSMPANDHGGGGAPAAPKPGYREIAEQLRVRIEAGEFDGLDERGKPIPLPSVAQLTEDFEVADGTVRNALRSLRDEGLVDMRQGHGTFVRRWKPIFRDANARLAASHWGRGRSIWSADIDSASRTLETRIRSIGVVENGPRLYHQLLKAPRLLMRDRVYLVDGRRIMWARSYFDAEVAVGTAIEHVDTGPGGTLARLSELGLGVTLFAEELEVRRARPEEQEILKVPADEPMARIVRLNATADERIVEVTDMVAVGEAYRFRWTFTS